MTHNLYSISQEHSNYSHNYNFQPTYSFNSDTSSFRSSIWYRQLQEEQQQKQEQARDKTQAKAQKEEASAQSHRTIITTRHQQEFSPSPSSSRSTCRLSKSTAVKPFLHPLRSGSGSGYAASVRVGVRAGLRPRTQAPSSSSSFTSAPSTSSSASSTPQRTAPTQALRTFTQDDEALLRAIRSKRTRNSQTQRQHTRTHTATSHVDMDLSPLDVFLKQRGVAVAVDDVGLPRRATTSSQPKRTRPHSPVQYASSLDSTTSTSALQALPHHTYTVSLRGLQNHPVLQALRSTCNMSLSEGEEDAEDTGCTTSPSFDLKLPHGRYVIFFKWTLLPAAMMRSCSLQDDDMDLCAMLQRQRQRQSTDVHTPTTTPTCTLVVLEAYSSTGILVQATPPLQTAKETLERRVAGQAPQVLIRVAHSPLHSARLARQFADGTLLNRN